MCRSDPDTKIFWVWRTGFGVLRSHEALNTRECRRAMRDVSSEDEGEGYSPLSTEGIVSCAAESTSPLSFSPLFRVTNKDVPYELGFWLRESDYDWLNPIHKLTKTSVSGGGLSLGTTQDYEVELKPGEYLYSCPLNTTPDYRLVVKG